MDVRVFFPMGEGGGVGLCAGREPGTGSGRNRGGFFFVSRMVALGLLPLWSVRCRFLSVNAGWVGCGSLPFVLFLVL